MLRVRALVILLMASCAGPAAPPRGTSVAIGPGRPDPAASALPPPARPAPPAPVPEPAPDEIDPAILDAEAATPIPDAPAKVALSGAAAVVWLPQPGLDFGFRSALVEPVGGVAKEVAARKEPVFVGRGGLWVLRTKKLASLACDECEACLTDPPSCKRDRRVDITRPFLVSLTSGKALEPWQGSYGPREGCKAGVGEHDTTLSLLGGVGSIYFVSVHSWDQGCGAAHPMFMDEAITFDLDTGKRAALSFPPAATPALKKRAHAELVRACVMDPKEEPAEYRALAAYGNHGELEGSFQFTMSAPYMCGTGPGHYSAVSEQVSDWLPPELERFGKLPAWLAAYLAKHGAKHAFMLGAGQVAAAKRQMRR